MYSYLPVPFEALTNTDLIHFPKKVDFFLRRTTDGWRDLEIYRDLNYSCLTSQSNNAEDVMRIMESAKMLSIYEEGEYLHFNFARTAEFELEKKFHLIENLLTSIYGSMQTVFSITQMSLTISNLISATKKIHVLAARIHDQGNKNGRKVQKFGEKQLWRALDIICKKEKNALDLLTFDINQINGNSRFSLLLRSEGIYYLLPSHILSQSYEKVIDKILSRPDVKFHEKQSAKGTIFENTLKESISFAGYKVGTIKGDHVKRVPEIDGIVSLSNETIIMYEAKCTVKPEERDDAFNFIENHLAKACDQLYVRKKFLQTHPGMAEERIQFPISGREIVCLVVTNHSYFTGMKIFLEDDSIAHVIDQSLLLQILSQKRMPSWSYDEESLAYTRSEVPLNENQEILNAITNPVSYLRSTAKAYINISDNGCAYEISSTPTIRY